MSARAEDRLLPWTPSAADPFDRRQAAHLLRRAGFAGTLAELDQLVALGPQAAVSTLLDATREGPGFAEAQDLLRVVAASDDLGQVRSLWLLRMLRTQAPLREKLALFWHGHFATSNRKVQRPRWMLGQLQLYWRAGLGRFRELLQAVSRDPAMIRWLDNDTNVKGRPNENFARELFELFALGRGHYTEQDIREAARAFSGWHVRGESFFFDKRQHDAGEKDVLGRRGKLTGDDVVDLAVAQPACAELLARKLLQWFVTPTPAAADVLAFAALLRELDLDVGAAVPRLLRSRLFFDRSSWRSRIKSPVELVAGMARQLGITASPSRCAAAVGRLGQELLEPPSVKGWDGERAWISSASWILRSNLAWRLLHDSELGGALPEDPWRALAQDPDGLVEHAAALLLDGHPSAATRNALRAAARGKEGGRVAAVLHAALTSPEYHLA